MTARTAELLAVILAAVVVTSIAVGPATASDTDGPTDAVASDSGTISPTTTQIGGCTRITTAGTYTLTQDIKNSTTVPCIRIDASNVILDGNGHTIDGTDTRSSGDSGAIFINKSVRTDNVTIRDLTVSDWRHGINGKLGTSITVDNVTATSNFGVAILLAEVSDTTLRDNLFRRTEEEAIAVREEAESGRNSNLVLKNNIINDTNVTATGRDRDVAIFVSADRSRFENNTIIDWRDDALEHVGNHSTFVTNTIRGSKNQALILAANNNRHNPSPTGNHTVRTNSLRNNGDGITVQSTNNLLRNNTVRDSVRAGIEDLAGGSNVFRNNTLRSNGRGSSPDWSLNIGTDADNNTVKNNTVISNGRGISVGGLNHTVVGNNVTGSQGVGIRVQIRNHTITDNHVISNGNNGMKVKADDVTLRNNTVRANNESGIRLVENDRNLLVDNHVTGNGENGIEFIGKGQFGIFNTNHTATDNTVRGNARDGIRIDASDNASLSDNVVRANGRDGVRLEDETRDTRITNITVRNNSRWAFSTSDAGSNNSVSRFFITANMTISFTARNVGLKPGTPRPSDPTALRTLNKYVNVSTVKFTANSRSWLELNTSYTDSEVATLNESDLRSYRWNGSAWNQIGGLNTVNTTRNVVSTKVTNTTANTQVTIFDKRPGTNNGPPNGSGTDNATFAVSNLTAPATATQGETLTVNATATNTGNATGQATIEYRFNGTVRDSTRVTLDAGNHTDVGFSFSTSGVAPGNYTHGIFTTDDTATAAIRVKAADSGGTNQSQRGPKQGPPPQDLASFQETSPINPQQATPNSLSGKIRVESQYRANTSVTLLTNSSTNYTLQISIPSATNVTFFLQETAVASSQNISDVKLLIDGNQTDYYVDSSAGPGRSPWILFEVPQFSTRTATFTSDGGSLFSDAIPGTGATNPPQNLDSDALYEDINGDGQGSFADAVALAFAQTSGLSQAQKDALDHDGDGDVDFDDAVDLAFDAAIV